LTPFPSRTFARRALQLIRGAIETRKGMVSYQSWYDSLIVAEAIEGQCGVLYSEDLQSGQRFGELEIKNPFI
jgi:predicted nucleic acid-binding protein